MARKVRDSIPCKQKLWEKHEKLYKSIFIASLKSLAKKGCSKGMENSISEQMCPIIQKECFKRHQMHHMEIAKPIWEGPISPVTDEDLLQRDFNKRPDFTCNVNNAFPESYEDLYIPFHIECKLLGEPNSPGWNFNKNYVINGINRFDSHKHSYGKRANSGMMIGYIFDMEPQKIFEEVSCHSDHELNSSVLVFHERVSESEQFLDRKHIVPKNFKLIHAWVDLRETQ